MTIRNWITEPGLQRMLAQGWTVVSRDRLADEGRVLLLLRHAGDRVETFRSLPLTPIDVEEVDPRQGSLF